MIRTVLGLVLFVSQALAGDLFMVERRSFENADPQDSRYFQRGPRQRVESRDFVGGRTQASFVFGPRTAVIYQCDLQRTVHLNLDTKRYFVMKDNPLPARASVPITSPPPQPESPRPAVRQSSIRQVEETKERKFFHGREAWLVRETQAGATTVGKEVYKYSSTTETWYIDLDAPQGCFKPPAAGSYDALLSAGGDPGEHRVIGSARRGYPIAMKVFSQTPTRSGSVYTAEVVEFSEHDLDPALFEIPPGFTETQRWEDIHPRLGPRLRWWESLMFWFSRLIH